MFFCALTQSPTASPALSLKSHNVFDHNALSKYVKAYGTDPISKEPMEMADVIAITPTLPPSTATASQIPQQTSIPTMLQSFQDAWDTLALELFRLREDLDKTRKELSLALYKQDAAVRVALKATKEKDELMKALAELGSGKPAAVAAGDENESTVNMNDFVATLQQTQQTLFAKHKSENKANKGKSAFAADVKLTLPESLESISDVPGSIHSLLVDDSRTRSLVTHTGGQIELLEQSGDKMAVSLHYDSTAGFPLWLESKPYVLATVPRKRKGRQTKKSKVAPRDLDLLLVSLGDDEKLSLDLAAVENEIIDVVAHPSLPVFAILMKNALVVCQKAADAIVTVYQDSLEATITAGAMHPDGLLLARGSSEGSLDIFDIASREVKLTMDPPADSGAILSIQFASNGYSVVVEYESKVGVYDLRKAQFQSILNKPNVNQEGEASNLFPRGISIDEFSTAILCGTNYSVYDKKAKLWLDFVDLSPTPRQMSCWFQNCHNGPLIIGGTPTGVDFGLL